MDAVPPYVRHGQLLSLLYQLLSTQALPGLQAAGIVQSGKTEFWLHNLTPFYAIGHTAQAFVVNTLNLTERLMLVVWLLCVLAIAIARFSQRVVRLSFAAAVTPIIALLVMTIFQPVLFYRPVQPTTLPLCLLIGLILAPGTGRISHVVSALGLVLLLAGLSNWNPSSRGGYIDKGAHDISENWRPGDRSVYSSDTVALLLQYDLQDLPSCFIPESGMGELPPDLQVMPGCNNYTAPGTWLVWPRSPVMDAGLVQSLAQATGGMRAAWRSDAAWQFGPRQIYYFP